MSAQRFFEQNGSQNFSRSTSKTPEEEAAAQPKQVISSYGVYSQMGFLQARTLDRSNQGHVFEQDRFIAKPTAAPSNQIDVFSSESAESQESAGEEEQEESEQSEEKGQFSEESESIDQLDAKEYGSVAPKLQVQQPRKPVNKDLDSQLLSMMLQKRKPYNPDENRRPPRLPTLVHHGSKK